MTTNNEAPIPAEVLADMQALTDALVAGRPVDAEVARRIEERAGRAREEILRARGVQAIGVQLIREGRGPLDEDQVRELTLAQRDLLRRGELRLKNPDTGTTYVLVPEEEYERLRGSSR